MSDLVEKARAWDLLVARSTELQARIEELERALLKATDKLERCIVYSGTDAEFATLAVEEFRAVLEKGKQPSAAESVGEEIENVAIVTRTVTAGQGRVEGEP
jgi:hypothetical protein